MNALSTRGRRLVRPRPPLTAVVSGAVALATCAGSVALATTSATAQSAPKTTITIDKKTPWGPSSPFRRAGPSTALPKMPKTRAIAPVCDHLAAGTAVQGPDSAHRQRGWPPRRHKAFERGEAGYL